MVGLFDNIVGQKSTQGNWDLREDQQPFQPDPNGIGDCTITLRRLLIFFSSIRLQRVHGHSFLPGNDAADELARRGVLLTHCNFL